jgi:hypothetical protein
VSVEPASPALERVVEVLSRIVPVAAAVRRAALRVAVVGTVAGGLIVYAALRDGAPSEATGGWLAVVVVVALVAAPPFVVGTFWLLLGEVVGLPKRIRRMPGETRAHAEELARLAREARDPHRGRAWHMPRLVWRSLRLTGASRELLTPYAPLLPLLSVTFLTAVAFAALGVIVELAVALVVALVIVL